MDDMMDEKKMFPGDSTPGGGGGLPNNESTQTSLYPLPPMRYIKLYNEVNIINRTAPPPPRPFEHNARFTMFGVPIHIDDTIIRSLESQGIRRLYPRDYDHKRELRKINASILVNFLDLIDVLIRAPDSPRREEKCSDLQMLFITMHHLINELRPHQAREGIRVALDEQKKQRIETSMRLNRQIDHVVERVQQTQSLIDINTNHLNNILQQTMPENFPYLFTTVNDDDGFGGGGVVGGEYDNANDTSKRNNFKSLTISGQHQQQQHHRIYGKISTNKRNNSSSSYGGKMDEATARMVQLDAFMCSLMDEVY